MTAISPRHLAFLVLINLVWGYNLIAARHGVEAFPPVLFCAMRFLVLALCMAPFLRVKRGQMRWLVTAALASGGLQFAIMFTGLAWSKSMSSVAIATQLGVPFTTLMSVVFLGERIRWRRTLGIVLAFAGILVMGFNPRVFESIEALGLVVLSAFVGAFGVVAIKRMSGVKPLELQAWLAWLSLPLLFAWSWLLEDGQWASIQAAGAGAWAALGYSSLVASLLAHTGFFWLLQRYPVTSVAPITVLSPLFSVVLSVWLLGDVLDWRILTGGALTLTGVVIVAARERAMVDTGT